MAISHTIRLSPFQAPTVWTLENGDVVERKGSRVRRFPLTQLNRVTRAGFCSARLEAGASLVTVVAVGAAVVGEEA